MSQLTDALKRMNDDDDAYFTYASIAWDALGLTEREVLRQLLFQGPVWDGCVVSKQARDVLIQNGLATRCCFMGEQGYTAATYDAYSLFTHGKGLPMTKKPGTPG